MKLLRLDSHYLCQLPKAESGQCLPHVLKCQIPSSYKASDNQLRPAKQREKGGGVKDLLAQETRTSSDAIASGGAGSR